MSIKPIACMLALSISMIDVGEAAPLPGSWDLECVDGVRHFRLAGEGSLSSTSLNAPPGADGPDCADFPNGLAEAQVVWEYHGSQMDLKFKAGFIGACQDSKTMVVRPRVGWFIVRSAN